MYRALLVPGSGRRGNKDKALFRISWHRTKFDISNFAPHNCNQNRRPSTFLDKKDKTGNSFFYFKQAKKSVKVIQITFFLFNLLIYNKLKCITFCITFVSLLVFVSLFSAHFPFLLISGRRFRTAWVIRLKNVYHFEKCICITFKKKVLHFNLLLIN